MYALQNARLLKVRNMDIKLKDLQGDQRELAEIIGIEKYLELVTRYGGTTIYIAKKDKLLNAKRDLSIVKKFNGYNYKSLANEYQLTERMVREIIARENKRLGGCQLSFFDDS